MKLLLDPSRLFDDVRSSGCDISMATGVIVFGSRAAGCHNDHSDLDLLCIGSGREHRSRFLDVVWRSPAELEKSEWLGSELAGHISKYGRVITGGSEWFDATVVSATAIARKERAVRLRARALQCFVSQLSPLRRDAAITRFRRDIQRYLMLQAGDSIPPSSLLDCSWESDRAMREEVVCYTESLTALSASTIRQLVAAFVHGR